jgi:ABC-type phosphate/phosphonate transport system substrate-binding protein/tRNA A-37 threonylcarbamoyl transferase component Bud32
MKTDSSGRDGGADEAIAQFLLARETGQPVDSQSLLRRYPQFADELHEFFRDDHHLANVLRPSTPATPSTEARTIAGDESPPADSPGRRAFGDFELLEEIGRGGMGIVYKARQSSVGRIVAIKMILSGRFASAAEVRRFEVEARNAANLEHPNIVPVHEIGCVAGQHYFTMRLVEGGSLAGSKGRFTRDPRAAAKLVATVARAVHYAHQHGILHRDLKPSNILLDDHDQPQVTDFGLARRLQDDSRLTMSGDQVGSPQYMSPEQARGERAVTTATDVYGLGATLYELLTGRAPFTSASRDEVLRHVREVDPPRPSAIGPKIDRDLETICLKCLEKEPARRYPTAEALAQDLERWLRHEPIEARPAGAILRLRRWIRRHPAVTTVISVLIIALIVVTALMRRYTVVAEDRANLIHLQSIMIGELGKVRMDDLDRLYTLADVKDLPPVEIPAEYRPSRRDVRLEPEADLSLRFGAYMRDEPTKMLRQLDRALAELEKSLGASLGKKDVRIRFVMYPQTTTKSTYENAREALLAGKVDFMRMGPASYVKASEANGGRWLDLLARHRVGSHRGGIFAVKGSAITKLAHLRGTRIIFQDEDSTTTVFAKALLADNGLRASDFLDVKHRINGPTVSDLVRTGKADVGVFNRTLVDDADDFQPVGEPFELFGQLWVARPGLREEQPQVYYALGKALLALPDEAFRAMGQDVKGMDPVNPNELKPVIEKVKKSERFDGTPQPPTTRPAAQQGIK